MFHMRLRELPNVGPGGDIKVRSATTGVVGAQPLDEDAEWKVRRLREGAEFRERRVVHRPSGELRPERDVRLEVFVWDVEADLVDGVGSLRIDHRSDGRLVGVGDDAERHSAGRVKHDVARLGDHRGARGNRPFPPTGNVVDDEIQMRSSRAVLDPLQLEVHVARRWDEVHEFIVIRMHLTGGRSGQLRPEFGTRSKAIGRYVDHGVEPLDFHGPTVRSRRARPHLNDMSRAPRQPNNQTGSSDPVRQAFGFADHFVMKPTCQAGVTSSILRLGAIGVAAIGFAACGGDSPETLGQALTTASDSIDWVAEDEQECIGGAILDTVGFDSLIEQGITSEALATTPTIVTELVDDGSAELDAAVEECVDADRLFRSSLASDVGLDIADCSADFSEASLAIDNRGNVMADGPTLELTDTPEHRDLLRPCLDAATFGEAFDLDAPEDLISAVQAALPVGLREISVSDDCLAERMVSKFGVENLDDLGLTVDTPDLDLDVFTDAEATFISDAAAGCSDATSGWRRELVNTHEPFADCVVAADGDAYNEQTIAIAFGESGARRDRDQLADDGLAACADEVAEASFPTISRLDRIEADFLARTWLQDWEVSSPFNHAPSDHYYRCTMRGAYAELGRDEVDDIFFEYGNTDPESSAAWDILVPFWQAYRDAQRACGGDWYFISAELHEAGASPETLDCIRKRLGDDDDIREMADTLVAYSVDINDYRWESVLSEIDANFDRCRNDSELRIYNEWHNYMLGGLDLSGVNTGVDSA